MISPYEIIGKTEERYNLRPGSILALSRKKTAVEARSVAMYLTRKLTIYSFYEIAEYFNRDHSTVQYACNKMVKVMENDLKDITYTNIVDLIDEFIEDNHD